MVKITCPNSFIVRNRFGFEVRVPCNKCAVCRKKKAAQDAMRCFFELPYWDGKAAFVTLTYNEESYDGRPHREHLVDFFHRIRSRGRKIKYFGVAESGGQFGRYHYHCIIFGISGEHHKCFSCTSNDSKMRDCSLVCQSWPYGLVGIDVACSTTISYVMKYILKDEEFQMKPVVSRLLGYRYFRTHLENIIQYGLRDGNGYLHSIPRCWLQKLERDNQSVYKDFLFRFKQNNRFGLLDLVPTDDQKLFNSELERSAFIKDNKKIDLPVYSNGPNTDLFLHDIHRKSLNSDVLYRKERRKYRHFLDE